MADGLGLVFEQHGNTGAAAYVNPAFEIGRNPLDMRAEQVRQDKNVLEQEFRQKEKQREVQNLQELNIDPESWDIDRQSYFMEGVNKIKEEGIGLAKSGKNLADVTDPVVKDWNRRKAALLAEAKYSTNQYDQYQKAATLALQNPDEFDYAKSMESLNANFAKLKPGERLAVDPNNLLARKAKPIDALAPIRQLALPVGRTTQADPTQSTTWTALKEGNLKGLIDAEIKSGKYDALWDQLQAAGTYKTKEEWKKDLFKYKKNEFVKDFSRQIFATKDDGAGTDTPAPSGAVGISYPQVYNPNTNGSTTTVAPNSVSLKKAGFLVPGQSGYRVATGANLGNNGITVKSGSMSTPLVLTNGRVASIPYDPAQPDKVQTYKIKNTTTGKMEDLSGTYDQISKQLIDKGMASFKPMVYAQGGSDYAVEDIWADAAAVIGQDSEDYATYLDLTQKADLLTQQYKTGSTEAPAANQSTSGTKKIKNF